MKEFFKKIWNWIVKACKAVNSWIRTDGWLHIAVSTLLMFVLGWIRPIWIPALIVLAIGIAKEIYDAFNPDKHSAEWHDLACDAIGIALGLLLIWINLLAK